LEDGFGFNFAMGVLNGGRIGIASQALGIATSGAYECIEIFIRA
jgi:alkylation response protein AidB-like acyl-CoA dehydrogenase